MPGLSGKLCEFIVACCFSSYTLAKMYCIDFCVQAKHIQWLIFWSSWLSAPPPPLMCEYIHSIGHTTFIGKQNILILDDTMCIYATTISTLCSRLAMVCQKRGGCMMVHHTMFSQNWSNLRWLICWGLKEGSSHILAMTKCTMWEKSTGLENLYCRS